MVFGSMIGNELAHGRFFFKKKSHCKFGATGGRDHGCFAGLYLELFGSLYRGHGCHGPMGLGSQKTNSQKIGGMGLAFFLSGLPCLGLAKII